jgi:NAD(P)-dependent dehydrogenase (short-subunit alcohol dehydrogenase family)
MAEDAIQLNNRVVIVTGASQGIGRATARVFASHGATVVINYHSNDVGARETLKLVETNGGKGIIKKADISNPESARQLIENVEQEIGPVEVLVNNAASFSRSHFLNVTLEELDSVLNTNIRGLYVLSQAAAIAMAKRKKGCIIHISSILAQRAVQNRSAYCASKGAVEGLTRAMALDLVPYNIRVNAVSPGLIRTDAMLAGFTDPAILAEVEKHIPGGRFGEPEDIANAALFLASDLASYINGEIISVGYGLAAREAGPAPRK